MGDMKTYTPYLKIDCGLGEAPQWEEATNSLRFVDIVKQKVHIIDLNKGPSSHRVLADLDISIGVTADIEGNEDEIAFGGKHGYGILNRKDGTYRYIKKYWDGDPVAAKKDKEMRGNDGGVDARGRFWASTMNDPLVTEPKAVGVVFRLDPDLSLHRMIEGHTITNGINWTVDSKTMYVADSPSKDVLAYDYDLETGTISNKRVFFRVEEEGGVPDGHAIDAEGYIWQAIYGCGKVVRISPEGKVVAEIVLPTRCPTCPCFVGEDLFVTSAQEEDGDKYPESADLAGSVFRCHVGVKGVPIHKFKYKGGGA